MTWDDDKNELGDRLLDLHLGELEGEEREALEAEVATSPRSAQRLDVERRLHAALKSRLQRVPAPPGLDTRIRAALDTDSGEAPVSSVVAATAGSAKPAWYRSPFIGAVAAAAMLAAFLFVNADEIRSMWGNPNQIVPVESMLVMVVDQACDELGQPIPAQKACTAPSHLNALRLPDGRYWQISTQGSDHRGMLTDRDLRGHQLAVAGRLFSPIQTFEIQTMQDLGETLETAALHRH